MNKLKQKRIEIQREHNLRIEDVVKEIGISQKSIYRVEDLEKFNNSIFIKYLKFLNRKGIDIKEILK